jgi:RHS repeat-associated protein
VRQYDYGSGAFGSLLQHTTIQYDTSLGAIVNMPSEVSVLNGSGTLASRQKYTYDAGTPTSTLGTPQHVAPPGTSRGNATTTQQYTGSIYLTSTATYYDTGNVNVFTDTNGGTTTYNYSSVSSTCGNAFPTSVNLPVSPLSRGYAWNCNGAVMTTYTDENNQPWTTAYNDIYYGRPSSTTDPAGTVTTITYGTNPLTTESALNFNGSAPASTADTLVTLDGLGRQFISQTRQSPSSASFDTVETDYDAQGRVADVTLPYTAPASCSYLASPSCTSSTSFPMTTTTYDGLNRTLVATDGGGGTAGYTYTQNDVLVNVGPAPNWQRQLEYDGAGRLTSVCELTMTLNGYGSCAQTTSQTGFWTKYTYGAINDLLMVSQNVQSGTAQTRTYTYDLLGRMASEQNPETNGAAYTYTYDIDTTCGTSKGNLVKRVDALSPPTVTCYAYDLLHRPTSVTYSGGYAGVTPSKHYVYDSATVNGQTMTNAANRLAEAYTGSTDLGFSYTNRGEISDAWQSTPNSGGYYHTTASYWAPGPVGLLNTRAIPGLLTWTYAPDGEGRVSSVVASSGQNPITNMQYNGFSEPTSITYGSGDSDTFGYNPNTGRMTSYTNTVGGVLVQSIAPMWNANGTLQQLQTSGTSTIPPCSYTYDDLSRLQQSTCGSTTWTTTATTYGYDPFGNIFKSGSISFQPTYNTASNQFETLPNVPTGTTLYDANGNLIFDGMYTYSWDAEGKMVQLNNGSSAPTWTSDALGRWVETDAPQNTYFGFGVAGFSQAVYDPTGVELALATGSALASVDVHVPLAAGAWAQYTGASLSSYWHPDWLGTSQMETTPSGYVSGVASLGPFGELPNTDISSNIQETFTGSAYLEKEFDLWDFPAREYNWNQARWVTPDPAGVNAVDPTNPQSWNRYAYVLNNPLALIDPLGLDYCAPDSVLTDGDGNVIGYSDGGCISDEQYGDGSAYPGYIYVSLTENTEVSTLTVPLQAFPSSLLGPDNLTLQYFQAQAPTATAFPTPQQVLNISFSYFVQSKVCGSSPSSRVLTSMRNGAIRGGAKGAFVGAVGGGFEGAVGAVPGAVFGGLVGGVIGAGGGAVSGSGIALACGALGGYH